VTTVQTTANQATIDMLVVARRQVAADVVEITLAPANGSLPRWEPGAHIDVVIPDTTRQYSLCGAVEEEDRWTIAVLMAPEPDSGSRRIVEALQEGEQVVARGPRNRFALSEAPRYEFIAGGIGITPLLPMIEEVASRGLPWHLTYGGRSRAHMAYVTRLVEKYGPQVTLCAQDEEGLIDLPAVVDELPPETAVYACGPTGMLSRLEELADGAAWDLHFERFSSSHDAHRATDEALEVTLARSGVTVHVEPDESILEAVEKAQIFVMSSCREGVCGSCETQVICGEIDHRDDYLTPEEREAGNVMMICVSRARGPLELDL
jgi:ferredoxin-NADP reductase